MKVFFNRKLFFILFVSVCSPGAFNLAHALTLEHKPYLQSGTTTGMTIRWRTDLISDTRLSYGTSPSALTSVIDDPILGDEHEVTITGLLPDTQYFYSVGSSTQVLAGGDQDHYFKTSPPPGAVKPVRIWAVGDSGTANASARAVRDAYLNNTGNAHTDLFLMLGDNAYNDGTDSEYTRAVFDMYPTVMRQTPTWPTMGNHDARSSNVYLNVFTLPTDGSSGGVGSGSELYYSYDYANIHFVVLDSQISSRAPTGAMLAWLEQDLALTTQQWVIVYWHHPPYTKGSHNSDNLAEGQIIDMRQNVLPILDSYGVDLVLGGHSHSYERSFLLNGHYGFSNTLTNAMKIDGGDGREAGNGAYRKVDDVSPGAVYLVAGSSGKVGNVTQHPAMYIWLSQLGSMIIDVNNNRLDARFINSNGNIGDNFTITKGPLINQPPTVSAGADQDTQTDITLSLGGTVSDDGLPVPPGTVTTLWRQISGPGLASFTDASAVDSMVGFIEVGVYVLQLSADDGEFETSDTVTITVDPPLPNQAPVVSAGLDIDVAPINDAIPLNGSADDDGKPIPPATVTTTWSTVSGPADVSFSDVNSVTSSAIFSVSGAYVLRLTASDGELSAHDDINVTVVDEIVLEENTAGGDKIDVKLGQSGAQSFRFGNTGDPDYQITKAVIYLSRELEAPNDNFGVNIGTGINSGALANSFVAIPATGTDSSSGISFTRYEITYPTPVGPLTAGTTYYINFENNATNGKAYYLEYTGGNTYPGGTYFKNATNDGKDIRFQISGANVGESSINNPPTFTADPIDKSPATEGSAYLDSIAADATDPNGDALSFSKMSGPDWLSVATNGALSGTPTSGDVGSNSFVVQVTDTSGLSASTTLNINVEAAPPPPPINNPPTFIADPTTKSPATEGSAYLDSIAADATDPNGDVLTFSKVSGPNWLFVAVNGTLSGTPGSGDVGSNSFVVQVTDSGGLGTSATLTISVNAVAPINRGPEFLVNPIAKPTATMGLDYQDSLAEDASDPDDDELSFSKVSGPTWLSVAANGELSGNPEIDDVGSNSFVIQIMDPDGLSGSATLNISVDVPEGEAVLEQNTSGGNKMDVKQGQSGAQSFQHGNVGDADYQITKLLVYLSREQEAPNGDLSVNIGTGINSGALANSAVAIPAASVDDSSGVSFTRYEITYPVPVGPLTAGTSYYINFENEAANGKAYYLEYAGKDTYPGGAYFKLFTDDGKDIHFEILGMSIGASASANKSVDSVEGGAGSFSTTFIPLLSLLMFIRIRTRREGRWHGRNVSMEFVMLKR